MDWILFGTFLEGIHTVLLHTITLMWASYCGLVAAFISTYQRVGGLIPSSAAYMSTCTPDTEPQTEAMLEILVEQMDCVG